MIAKLCPICAKTASDAAHAPFCSKRCQDVDLSRWLSGRYAIAGEPVPQEDDDGTTPRHDGTDTVH